MTARCNKTREMTIRGCRAGARVRSYFAMPSSRLGRATFGSGALLFALYLFENLGAERFGATALLLYLPQHGWGLLPLVLMFLALWRRDLRLACFNAAALLFWAHFLLGYRAFGRVQSGKTSSSFRVMTYNIERGVSSIDALEATIRAQKPDIVCLQETQGVDWGHAYAPGALLTARFPGWSAARGGDVTTLSRFPMSSHRDYPLRGTRRILETTLQTPLGRVRVLNIHVATSFSAPSRTRRGAKLGKIGRIAQIMADARPSAQARMQQIAPLHHAIARGETGALIMAGDFNSPPRGRFYGAISRGLEDVWERGGRGTGDTFPARFPLLPIDHILVRGLIVDRAFVPDVRASDHRPLIADFSVRPPA